MNKKIILKTWIFSCLSFVLVAQEKDWTPDPSYNDNIRHKEIIINTTPLISQFIPFNASTLPRQNVFDFQVRKLRNGRGTRWGLGVNIDSGFNPLEPSSFYARFGFVRRRQIAQNFHFYRSWDGNLLVEDLDGTNPAARRLGFSGIAVSYSAGFEYSINKTLTLSTEGVLLFGILGDTGDTKIKFIPPIGLFFHVKF
ncbi:MAG: hypothetical protein JNL70_26770 [Saprospiraceae bacterium]|nr:hypothetical protein [Saprospiraceae bacterium]